MIFVAAVIFAAMNTIGDRITWSEQDGSTVFVITQQVEGWKVSALAAWLMAWSFCGAYFIYSWFGDYSREIKLFLVVMIAFWLYFLVRTGRAYFWRRFGKELIRIKDGVMTYKKDIRSYGKAFNYFIENISQVKAIELSKWSFARSNAASFWIVGGETIEFTYQGKVAVLGCQLNESDTRELVGKLKNLLAEERKKASLESS